MFKQVELIFGNAKRIYLCGYLNNRPIFYKSIWKTNKEL